MQICHNEPLCYLLQTGKALPAVLPVKENIKKQKLNTAVFLTLLVPCQLLRHAG